MAPGYRLTDAPPLLETYLDLRRRTGLSPKTAEQGRGALAGSWSWCCAATGDDEVVAMGRVIGDGGWYFHIADVATHPDHRRRGLARAVLEHLIADIRSRAPADAYVSLIADPPGVPLYEAVGLRPTAPSVAMALVL